MEKIRYIYSMQNTTVYLHEIIIPRNIGKDQNVIDVG